jgi:hypothetical protein
MRNLAAKVPEDLWPELKARVQACYQAPSRAIARDLAAGVAVDYARELPSAVACFEDDFEACIAHLRMPITHRRAIRTTNLLERLFLEERRRLKIIPNAFGERPVLKLMFGAMIRAAERWRAIKVTDFERRQMTAVRQQLDQEHDAASRPRRPRQHGALPPIYPADLGVDGRAAADDLPAAGGGCDLLPASDRLPVALATVLGPCMDGACLARRS